MYGLLYKDDLFFNSPLAHLDMLSAKYCASALMKSRARKAYLDVVLV
jgi:hypothetical protein